MEGTGLPIKAALGKHRTVSPGCSPPWPAQVLDHLGLPDPDQMPPPFIIATPNSEYCRQLPLIYSGPSTPGF